MGSIFPRRTRSRLPLRAAPAIAVVAALALVGVGCGGQGGSTDSPGAPTSPGGGVASQSPRHEGDGLGSGSGNPGAADTTPRPDGEPYRVVFLGDSLSAGFGLAEDQAFPGLVQEQLRRQGHPVDVINAGVSGDTTAGGLSRLDWVLRSEPHLLVVELGANDALRGQPLENTERNLREIVRRGRDAGARILLVGMDVPTNYGPDYTRGFADLYGRIAAEEQVELLPEFIREVGLDPALMMADGIHPTAEGHLKLAARLTATIERMLDAG